MKRIYYLFVSFFVASLTLAQPANDDCSTAQAIGSLPTPAACPSGAGASVTVPGTLNGATPANPYTYQGTGCTGSSTTMAAPANDVWYTFVATGYQLNLTISGTVANPNVAVYSGTCASLGGGVGGCAVGTAGGSATLTVNQMVIGQTYYLQVSGNSAIATGTFTMSINNSIDCNNCLGGSNLTVTPPPTNGAYPPGTTVNFCFKINSYTQVNTNWLHGVQLAFGSGWNMGSLTTTSPPACQGSGYWAYYAAGITDNSGQAWPPGFYFETVTGQNNPGNNFGDNCSGNISAANWKFCFSIKTATACNPGADLSVVINTSGDGESGSWSSLGCSGDPATTFNAIGACCPPAMSSTPVSCFGGSDGTATATPVGTQNPYIYTWTNSSGVVVSTTSGVAGANTATGLPAGTYTVSITDKNNCVATNTVTITQPTAVTLALTPTNATCGNANGSISATAGGGTPGYTYEINGGGYGASSTFSNLAAGTYTIDAEDSKGCIKTATVTIISPASPTVTVNSGTTCNGGSVVLNAGGATTYSWSPGAGLSGTTGSSVTANPGSTTIYTVTGTTGGCTDVATATVTVVTNPTVTVAPATICTGQTTTLTANGATTYSWSPGTGLSSTSTSTVAANPTSTTVYTITGTSGTCTSVATTTVTVNPLPIAMATSNTPCVNQNLNLNAGGGTGYSWSGPNSFSSSQQNPSVNGASTADAGVYTVTVTDANSCVNTATVNVTVNPLPVVVVTGATVCIGGTINLTATGGVNYSWNGPNAYSSNVQNPGITNATVNMSGSYVVVVTDANGCTNAGTAQVSVNPGLVITAGSNSPICENATLNLTANPGVSWAWTGPNNFSSNQQNPNIFNSLPNMSGTYSVTGTDINGCTGTSTVNVTINPLPIVTATSATICVGSMGTITGGGALTYTWSNGSNSASQTLSPASSTSYTVVATDNNSCINFATASITVNALPVIGVNSSAICIGNTTTLTATGAANYSWNPSTGLSNNTGNPVTANPTSTTVYTVTGTDLNTCVNTAVTTVTVNPLPNITTASAVICAGGQTTLSASGANTYNWSPSTGLNSTNGASVGANPTSTTAYTVTGTDNNGCQNIGTLTVTVNPLPAVTIGPQSTSGCAPVCVNFSNTAVGNGGTCAWNFNDGGTSNLCAVQHCFAAQGSYSIQLVVTDNNGCINSSSALVTVYPVPHADFNVTPQPTTILDNTIYYYNASYGANITSLNWNLGNGTTSVLQNPSSLYGDTGTYQVQLVAISDHGCRDSTIKYIKIDPDYMLYVPNAFSPNSDGTNDVFYAKGDGIRDFRMYIFDRWGQQIFFSDDLYKGWDGRFQSKGEEIVQQDVYVWKIELKTVKGEKKSLSGHVSLIK